MSLSAQQLKRLRRQRGWTQRDMARALDVSLQAVKHWEQGRRAPAPRHEAQLLAAAPSTPVCSRPRYADLAPGDWAAAAHYGWAELKYDGHYAEIRGGPGGWTATSRTGRVVASGFEPLPRCHLLAERIADTEWAGISELHGTYVVWGALSIRGTHLDRPVMERLVAQLQEAGLPVLVSERCSLAAAPALWRELVEDGGWEGLVLRTAGGRFARMKARVTMDYVCTGVDGDSAIGALYNRRGKLIDRVRVPCPDTPQVGRVFEASGLARTAQGSLRNPRWECWRDDKPPTDCQ